MRPITTSNFILLRQRQAKVLLDLLAQVDEAFIDQPGVRIAVLHQFVQVAELEDGARVDAQVLAYARRVRLDGHPDLGNAGRLEDCAQRGRHQVCETERGPEHGDVKERDALAVRELHQRHVVLDAVLRRGLGFPFQIEAEDVVVQEVLGHVFGAFDRSAVVHRDVAAVGALVHLVAPELCGWTWVVRCGW